MACGNIRLLPADYVQSDPMLFSMSKINVSAKLSTSASALGVQLNLKGNNQRRFSQARKPLAAALLDPSMTFPFFLFLLSRLSYDSNIARFERLLDNKGRLGRNVATNIIRPWY